MAVVHVLSPDEQTDTRRAIYEHFGVTDDPSTWETANFPAPDHPFLSEKYAVDERAFRNRMNPAVVSTFAALYRVEPSELVVVVDHYGFRRGTVFGETVRPDWRPKPLRLHWDVNVLEYVVNGPRRYQGLLAVNDNSQHTGSFACVPGSAHELGDWVKRGNKPDNSKYVPASDPLQRRVQRIPLRAGDMVVWDMGTAHANFVNYSNQPRMMQFMRLVPRKLAHLEKQAIVHMPHITADALKILALTRAEATMLG